MLHVLDKAGDDGHCYLPENELIPLTRELLTSGGHEAESAAIALILSEMVKEEQLIRELDDEILCYKPSFFHSEKHLAKLLQQKLETSIDESYL